LPDWLSVCLLVASAQSYKFASKRLAIAVFIFRTKIKEFILPNANRSMLQYATNSVRYTVAMRAGLSKKALLSAVEEKRFSYARERNYFFSG
jgi:Flp pilus assembly protein protease CpaA